MQTLPNISRIKSSQIMKFDELIKYKNRNNLFKNHAENGTERQVPDCFQIKPLYEVKAFFKVKACDLLISFNIFQQFSTWNTINTNTNCVIQTTDPEICQIMIFQKRVWKQFFHHIWRIIFQEKYFSFYILETRQISLCD